MSPVSNDAKLSAAVARTLEELCFYCAESGVMPAEPIEGASFARVRFAGHWDGELVIGVDNALLREFAEGLLGEDAASEDDIASALMEIANVVCGNALPDVESSAVVFALGSPALCGRDTFGSEGLARVAQASLDRGHVVVRLFRDPVAA